ncbi:alpha- and gamma-adaptin-binding protein p34 [Palaemon carinicauda]|uniref:alpha- and gamma-adaptin-binding protein p34 n=1 Tax=Palaemon carinicauda TaxID=392227 RepID=UPI0035B5AE98
MEDCPSLVILPLHGKKSGNIVKGILDVDALPTPSVIDSKFQSWPWKIKNKYYTADIQLVGVECLESPQESVLSSCEALIVYCDSLQATAIENLNSLLESMGSLEPEVKMLVCDGCSSDDDSLGLSRLKAQQWCISNGWELIELNKVEEEDSGQEDDFPESWGFQRIRQALHAHTWSNLEMRDVSNANSLNAMMQSVVAMDERKSENSEDSSEVMYSRLEDLTINSDGNSSNQISDDGLPTSTLEEYFDSGDGDFEKLFSSFEQMKRTAASLPLEHRRDYAEKVAISFWNAIGGPEDELDGLDSD